MLTVDGKTYGQSLAIATYCARECGKWIVFMYSRLPDEGAGILYILNLDMSQDRNVQSEHIHYSGELASNTCIFG